MLPLNTVSIGMCLFLTLVYPFTTDKLLENWALCPAKLIQFEMHRLTTYPLVHLSLTHLLFNCLAFYPFVSKFEEKCGSFHTCIALNTVGALTGVGYSIITYLLKFIGLDLFENNIAGSSGWVFSFLSVYAITIGSERINLFSYGDSEFKIKGIYLPWFYLILSAILIPSSSFIGHSVAIGIGYALGLGWLKILLNTAWAVKLENFTPFKKLVGLTDVVKFNDEKICKWWYEVDVEERYGTQLTGGVRLGTTGAIV